MVYPPTLNRYWHRFTKQISMPLLRRDSSSSTSSIASSTSSTKSVRFEDADTVFFTHGSDEYDRSAVRESKDIPVSLGHIFLSEPEQAIIQNSQQDNIVKRNTLNNGRRSSEGYAVLLKLRSRSKASNEVVCLF